MNSEAMNDFRETKGKIFDTSSFADHIPLFLQKLGPQVELSSILEFENIQV
jgi:hypothetical protein